MGKQTAEDLLNETRAALLEARALLDGGTPPGRGHGSLIGLYDDLRDRLSKVEGRAVREALERIAATVESLTRLSGEVEKLRGVRRAIKNGA